MAEVWRTYPVFEGDDWHELRDAQYDQRENDLAIIMGRVCDMYLRASVVMAREDDPVAEAIRAGRFFDARSLMVAHAHLAAFWRLKHGHVNPSLPGILDMWSLLDAWENWVMHEVTLWILDNPRLVRLSALVCARSLVQTRDTIVAEMDLWDALKEYYALPPPDQGDLFDDPASYTPYS